MADEQKRPEAGNAGTPAIDVAAITQTVTEQVTAALGGKIEELVKNQKVLADTLAADKKAAQDAAATQAQQAAKPEGAKKDADQAEAPLTAEAVSKLVADAIAADRKAQAESAAKAADRQKLIERIAAEKLGGDKELGALLAGDDEASLTAAAERLAARLKTYRPDFGGAAKDGGAVPGAEGGAPKPNLNLSPGTAAFAAGIKLPA